MHTEKQARELWCPVARVAVGNYSVAVNRDEGDEIIAGCRCIASECAMWRWSLPRRRRGDDEGYCGLVE
jgi:hypothetical protein